MQPKDIKELLLKKGLKVTHQRMAVLEAVINLKGHPTADEVIGHTKEKFPSIAVGTIYKILETLVGKGIIKKVKTENGVMRYDGATEHHHHLYSIENERIEDYYDKELDDLIHKYLKKKKVPGFTIKEFKLQILGEFKA
jgi:Fur family transcriptional regulator, peroxide stress response regulator